MHSNGSTRSARIANIFNRFMCPLPPCRTTDSLQRGQKRGCVIDNRIRALIVSIFITVFAGPLQAADLAGLVETCDGCHGVDGVSEWIDMPTIAGIDAFVHSEALYIYQDGARPCSESAFRRGDTSRPATSMCEVSAGLEDEDIEALAAHYSELPFVPSTQEFDAELAAAGKTIHESGCDMCHSDGGSNPDDEASILAGQWAGYLEKSFVDYRSGEREQPPSMKRAVDALSDEDVAALINYYASQQ
jgi:sulfide dehydrogenase cytochrome subunit